jgi:uncharacterized protein (UPF0335 family)
MIAGPAGFSTFSAEAEMTAPTETTTVNSSPDVQERIASFAERLDSLADDLDRIAEERKAINQDVKEVVAEAKGQGFDGQMIRRAGKELHRMRADRNSYEEEVSMWELYWRAVLNSLDGDRP